jgi:hypothetical protein
MNFFNPFRRPKPQPSKPEHVHSWRAIAVNRGSAAGVNAIDGSPRKATEILLFCDCGSYETTFAYGHWTLEQVSAGEISKDVAELRKMAGLG